MIKNTRIDDELSAYCGDNLHPKCPLLRIDYALSNRYPAGDFTPWIARKLTEKNFQDIAYLLDQLTLTNPGVSIGGEGNSGYWANYAIDLCNLNLKTAIVFDNEKGYLDLHSALFPYVLHGSLDGFIIIGIEVEYLARAISPYRLFIRDFDTKVKLANEFITRMRQETKKQSTAWTDFELLDFKKLNGLLIHEVPANNLRAKLREVSIGARQLFFGTLEKGAGQGGWSARPYGIDEDIASIELANVGLGELQGDPEAVLMTYRNEELLTALSDYPVKQGWKKKFIVKYMLENAPYIVERLVGNKKVFAIQQDFLEEGALLSNWIASIKLPLAVTLA